jgi:hypothetical protein
MISITTPTFDLDGVLTLQRTEESDQNTHSRRVTRTATLDGSAVLVDQGYSHADRTIKAKARQLSQDDFDRAAYLLQTYPLLVVSCEAGVFTAAPERLTPVGDGLDLLLLVSEKLNA